jgi:hypothetical protein
VSVAGLTDGDLFKMEDGVDGYENGLLLLKRLRYGVTNFPRVALDNAAVFLPAEGRVGEEDVDLVRQNHTR